MKSKSKVVIAAMAAVVAVALAGCSSGGGGSSSSSSQGVVIKDALWDPTQLPVYKQCAVEFKKETGITVQIKQTNWPNYWSNLITELSAGTAPDVFTDHVAYFAQLQEAGQIVNLSPYFKKDKYTVPSSVASNKLWNIKGAQYAVSQDQDVEGLLYNTKDVPSDMTPASLSTLNWNSSDGGTFGKAIAHMTIDKNGNRGDSPNFDKNAVKTYGFAMESGPGVTGQTQWSPFILSTGWNYTNKNPFGSKYYLDDPKMVAMWKWLQTEYKDGYIAPVKLVTSLGEQPVLDKNVVAMMMQGSWEAAQRVPKADKAQTFAWAQLPSGPIGHPVSITNSIGPSVTTSSKHPAQAAKWAEFIVSPKCADIVAKSGVEITTVPAAATKALATLKAQGVDTSHWQQLLSTPADLQLYPITSHSTQITDLGNTAFDDTLAAGTGSPEKVLKQLNTQVNQLLKGN
jgi:multiple sugar transport system substrate-binding protein